MTDGPILEDRLCNDRTGIFFQHVHLRYVQNTEVRLYSVDICRVRRSRDPVGCGGPDVVICLQISHHLVECFERLRIVRYAEFAEIKRNAVCTCPFSNGSQSFHADICRNDPLMLARSVVEILMDLDCVVVGGVDDGALGADDLGVVAARPTPRSGPADTGHQHLLGGACLANCGDRSVADGQPVTGILLLRLVHQPEANVAVIRKFAGDLAPQVDE
ncbi:hypothetical protein D3C73_838210 [compost metagenome]